ncbi:protein NEN1-like isoform X1 [Salvia splendens]|uniref:protein NEN1-like isoform X1 n=1 Tax=Salvia splendens TaxID=180675 RepID=UPI001C26C0AE|nr:protein NEN1-like isoform X1 [Salvia splendens]
MAVQSSEIVFFDVETTIPTRTGQGYALLEFGAITVCPMRMVELRSYSTLIRPADLSLITSLSVRCNGITKDTVVPAPSFADVADQVYDLLHVHIFLGRREYKFSMMYTPGRIWAGHNILRFDCPRILEAFSDINRPAPEPKGAIDTLQLLTQKFGRRAGDMKMATLASYFGLGKQTHRSLDDVRMNLEVLKYCATVLFLESTIPDILIENSEVSPIATPRRRTNGKDSTQQIGKDEIIESPSDRLACPSTSSLSPMKIEFPPTLYPSSVDMLKARRVGEANVSAEPNAASAGPFDLGGMRAGMEEPLPEDSMEEEDKAAIPSQESSTSVVDGCFDSFNDFLEPDGVSIPSISVTLASFYPGTHRIQILHQNFPLQLKCASLKVRFGISTKFVDHAGRPRLNFVVDASPNLCNILDGADRLAQKLSTDSGSSSEWHHVVGRKQGFFNSPTVRLHLPTLADGEINRWTTEIYQKESSTTHKLVFSRYDVAELNSLFTPGHVVDAYFALVAYDFQQNAGIRLVAKKLIVHPSS